MGAGGEGEQEHREHGISREDVLHGCKARARTGTAPGSAFSERHPYRYDGIATHGRGRSGAFRSTGGRERARMLTINLRERGTDGHETRSDLADAVPPRGRGPSSERVTRDQMREAGLGVWSAPCGRRTTCGRIRSVQRPGEGIVLQQPEDEADSDRARWVGVPGALPGRLSDPPDDDAQTSVWEPHVPGDHRRRPSGPQAPAAPQPRRLLRPVQSDTMPGRPTTTAQRCGRARLDDDYRGLRARDESGGPPCPGPAGCAARDHFHARARPAGRRPARPRPERSGGRPDGRARLHGEHGLHG